MGVVVRGRLSFSVDLPDLVWMPLVGKTASVRELEAVDALAVQIVSKASPPRS